MVSTPCWLFAIRYSLFATHYSLSSRHALDLGAHQALDQVREIVVEPGLEHGPQELADHLLEGAAVARVGRLDLRILRERMEGGIDRRRGRRRHEAALGLVRRA